MAGTDKIDLTAFDIEGIDAFSMTFGDDGVTLDLAEIDGGTVLLADLTTIPDAGDFFDLEARFKPGIRVAVDTAGKRQGFIACPTKIVPA